MTNNDQKLLLFQIDALSYEDFRRALDQGLLPQTKLWLKENNYIIDKYYTGLPASTFAFQAQLFFGSKKNIPSYRWYDKKNSKIISAFLGKAVKNIQDNFLPRPKNIFKDLVVLESVFSPGDKYQSFASETNGEGIKIKLMILRQILLDLIDFRNFLLLKILFYLPTIFFHYLRYWLTTKRKDRVPFRWWVFLFGHLSNFGFIIPYYFNRLKVLIKNRVSPIYVNYGGYDAIAHSFGSFSSPAQQTLKSFDGELARILDFVRKEGYLSLVFSDHGQTDARIFIDINGENLKQLFSELCGVRKDLVEEMPSMVMGADREKTKSEILITNSSSVSLVYFTRFSQRLTKKEIEETYPGLIKKIALTPGIGMVIVKDEQGYLIEGKEGSVFVDGSGRVKILLGDNPIKKYGRYSLSLKALTSWIVFENQGDLILMGDFDGQTTVSFEEQVATHLGLGGEQSWPFYCCPQSNRSMFLELAYG